MDPTVVLGHLFGGSGRHGLRGALLADQVDGDDVLAVHCPDSEVVLDAVKVSPSEGRLFDDGVADRKTVKTNRAVQRANIKCGYAHSRMARLQIVLRVVSHPIDEPC